MKTAKSIAPFLVVILFLSQSCIRHYYWPEEHIRQMVDPVGFSANFNDFDTVVSQLDRQYGSKMDSISHAMKAWTPPSAVIVPHDDFAYAGYLYPPAFENIRAKTLLLVGVFHKARTFGVEDKLVFGNFTHWNGPMMRTEVSPLRNEILKQLDSSDCIVSDTMMQTEHSLEAFIPWLQFYNPGAQIIPVLVPAMDFERMNQLSEKMVKALQKVSEHQDLSNPEDFCVLISSDAVHYGKEGWGGKNLAPLGSGKEGNQRALQHEHKIINESLTGKTDDAKVKRFLSFTTDSCDHRNYKWTWCGRYSIPFGLLTADKLQGKNKLEGKLAAYATSIDHKTLDLKNTQMGTTAPAHENHWVGYALIFYK